MKRLHLIVMAYYFPPDGGAGTQRALKFCKYLSHLGWDVSVIARAGGGGKWAPPDPSLGAELPPNVSVHRVDELSINSWCRAAHDAALEAIARSRPDALLLTMSPFQLAPYGVQLKQATGVPVVMDLRDPWTFDGWPAYQTWWHWIRDRALMKASLRESSGIIVNTPEAHDCFAHVLRRRLPPITVITNGYDAEDFSEPERSPTSSEFTLVLTGSTFAHVLYPPRGLLPSIKRLLRYRPEPIRPTGRTPFYLLRALCLLQHSAGRQPVRIVICGASDDSLYRLVSESGVADQVVITGYLPHAESVRWLRQADALFLPLHDLPPGVRSRIVPGKTYEYLASGRPILACLPPGDAHDLVSRSGVGFIASPCDANAIASTLNRMLELWRSGSLPSGPAEWVKDYERLALTARLSEFLRSVIADALSHGARTCC